MKKMLFVLPLLIFTGVIFAQSGGIASGDGGDCFIQLLTAEDAPNDAGGDINITWVVDADAALPDSMILERFDADGAWHRVAGIMPINGRKTDANLENGQEYTYRIVPFYGDIALSASVEATAVPRKQWIHKGRIGMLILLTLISLAIFYYIEQGKRGKDLYIRRIAGLTAVEDAVGRATEMGRPVLYIPGIMDMDDIQTIASMVILSRVAMKTAEYGSSLLVPTCRSVVMSVAQETVKESYMQMGRPDAYQKGNINYITDDQFGYAAGVDGIMLRQKPAAIFMLGTFYAESLILAETGRSVGAIQIAGTAMPSQIPFFIAACDYTLIGEELFAASAYLSREPKLLGSLRGQDVAKLFFMIVIVIGVLAATIGEAWGPAAWVADFLKTITSVG
ncbi:MAG: DUF6754 domain-containing protein [Candidatus Fermentibacteria bacterium]|nr:DUF6754 domain-containing protein [Candidatus Fermentibacteria bacterium]